MIYIFYKKLGELCKKRLNFYSFLQIFSEKIETYFIICYYFPRSLLQIGLTPDFTNEQFCAIMEFERYDELRELSHQEWIDLQSPEYIDGI